MTGSEEFVQRELLDLKYIGTLVGYYFVCSRKMWLFDKQLNMEGESDLVALGKLLGETAYRRQKKDIEVDQKIVLDWIDFRRRVVHEVKKSDALEEAHVWQLKYYLFYLEQKGAEGFRGQLNYPKQKKWQWVELTKEDRNRLWEILQQMEYILNRSTPPKPKRIPACSKCSYFEFCWV